MATPWTPEAVLALAPDASSAKSAQELASVRQWQSLGRQHFTLWGEIKGSGSNPYQSRIDLREPAFKCSCPSRKFPCKHGLALLLVFAREAQAFEDGEPPAWVTEWLSGREQRAEKRAEKAAAAPVVDEKAQQRRVAQRENRISDGLDELGVWLRDLLRLGLGTAQTQPSSYWESVAARLVDAQASGLARLARQLEDTLHTGPGWESRLLHDVARLELVRRAYARQTVLPAAVQSEVRGAAGWNQAQEEVLAGAGVRDRWRVLGSVVESDEQLRMRRTWLWGKETARPALLLDFAAGTQALDAGLPVGSELPAELAFYAGAMTLRALVKAQDAPAACSEPLGGAGTIEQALAGYAQALGTVPWLGRWPMTLGSVRIQVRLHESGVHGWSLVDSEGMQVTLPARFEHGWGMLAVSGGKPGTVFGEWDGETLRPLTMEIGGAVYGVGTGVVPASVGVGE